MSNYETIPVKDYFVKNNYTGKTYDCFNFEDAENMLIKLRFENQHDEFIMCAVIDA